MLIKKLQHLAARVLHNTHSGGPKWLKDKFELISEAYGDAAVEEDFEKWCNEILDKGLNPRYPITEYIKVIDERLGGGFVEPSRSQFDVNDPAVVPLSSLCYELTGYLPSPEIVATLIKVFPSAEIAEALKEYVSGMSERELRAGGKQFFTKGGAAAVIHARQERMKK